ncbi:hypothetical protein VB773_20145 [Haloarculaceae archaeon H-GB2-1]|nr:hypothetical protein [Haloarculaceae archaeon H-GB11]MEA5409661.1 hypothetical protein [Haloarculaceae archaeon H-GB2-1]
MSSSAPIPGAHDSPVSAADTLAVQAQSTAESDRDGDGLSDAREAALGTDPTDRDTDGDLFWDRDEVNSGTDPTDSTDYPHRDSDGDKYTDRDELEHDTDPNDPADFPADADSDGDKLTDDREQAIGTDPTDRDTDGDGYWDGHEWRADSDPLDARSTPGSCSAIPSAKKIPEDGDFHGKLTENDSTHWYCFETTREQAIRLVGYVAPGRLIVLNPSNETLLDQPRGGHEPLASGVIADETGTYYVGLQRGTGASDVWYDTQYLYTLSTAEQDPAGENDRLDSALSLRSGQTIHDTRAEGDSDWFAVSADAGDIINASLRVPFGDSGTYGNNIGIELYAPNGTRIGEIGRSKRAGTLSNQTFITLGRGLVTATQRATVDQTGTYYVHVTNVSVEGYTEYNLTVNVSGAEPSGDTDGDGLSDAQEADLGTDPTDRDTDDDHYWDRDEVTSGTDPTDSTDYPHRDSDGDKYTDLDELEHGTDPQDPTEYPSDHDSDGDKLTDDRERAIGTDPTERDTDGDGYWDGDEWRSGHDPTIPRQSPPISP